MLREILESVSNRDVIKEIAKTVDNITAMKPDGKDLIINGTKDGKKVNFTLSGKIDDYSGFAKFFDKYKDNVNKELKK